MKRLFLLLTATVLTFGFAQAQLKPEAGSMGLGFRLTGIANVSFSNWMNTDLSGQQLPDPVGLFGGTSVAVNSLVPQEMLFGRYYLSSDLALRVGLGINSVSMKSHTVDSIGANILTTDDKTSAFSFGISAGVEKHFASAASKLDPYAGAQINFASIGSIKNEFTSNLNTDPAQDNTVMTELAGGSSFGVNLLAGFNYFFSDNFAIGAEMGWGFRSTSVGGDWSQTSTSVVGGTSTTSTSIGNAKSSTSGLGVGSTAGINASIFW